MSADVPPERRSTPPTYDVVRDAGCLASTGPAGDRIDTSVLVWIFFADGKRSIQLSLMMVLMPALLMRENPTAAGLSPPGLGKTEDDSEIRRLFTLTATAQNSN